MITRVEANEISQQDCVLPLNTEKPYYTKLNNTLIKCHYHKKGTQVSEPDYRKTQSIQSYMLIHCVSSLWQPSNASGVARLSKYCLNGIFHNIKPKVITMQSTA